MAVSPDGYRWLLTSALEMAGCVTVAAAPVGSGFAQAFGAKQDRLDFPLDENETWARFVETEAATVVVEDNGYQGSRSEVLRAASRASGNKKAASITWNVEGLVLFTCAQRGRVLAQVDLTDVGEDQLEDLPRSLHRLALSVNSDDANPVAVGAAMVAKFTRAGFDADVLEQGSVFALTPPPNDLQNYHAGLERLFSQASGPLFQTTVAAPPERQRVVARLAAHVAAREAGLASRDDVQALLASLDQDEPRVPPSVTAASASAQRRATTARYQEMDDDGYGRGSGHLKRTYLNQECNAWDALRQATHPDPLSAAITSLYRCLFTITGSVVRYPHTISRDAAGHPVVNTENLTSERRTAFINSVMCILDGSMSLDAAVAGLPDPLTDNDRDSAVARHQTRFANGEFNDQHPPLRPPFQ